MESKPTDILYKIALSRLEGIGSVLFKILITRLGSAQEVFQTPLSKLSKIPGIGPQLSQSLRQKTDALLEAEKILKYCNKNRITVLEPSEYPLLLKQIYDAPPLLYTKGLGSLQDYKTLAVVGTRKASAYGKSILNELIENLTDVQIISGLAYGIDIAAHKAALQHQKSTVAVLANGLHTVYPSVHKKVADQIQENGLLVSEQPPFLPLHPNQFIARNRIIAGLAQAVLIVESKHKGGSMVTAEMANHYNREVFAVPGDLHKPLSEGPLQLIHDHKAQIYLNPKQLSEIMLWTQKVAPRPKWENESERSLIEIIANRREIGIDELSWRTEIPLNQLASHLLELEFKGVVKQLPGKKFSLA